MLKIIGISLIFLSTLSVGIYSSYKTKNKLKQLREMISFMNYIRTQIEFFNTPINNIYDSYCPENEQFGEIVADISANGWNNAIEKNGVDFLPKNVIADLKEYGNMLGKSNKDEQLSNSRYYIQLLENEYRENEKKAPEKIKLSIALGVYAGLMLVILFI